MIALVSSTLVPPPVECCDGARSVFTPAERLAQTRATVDSLLALGFSRVVVADNSPGWDPAIEPALAPAEVWRIGVPVFRNKGLSELYLLQAAAGRLPAEEPVVKVSGRYSLSRDLLAELGDADLAVKSDGFGERHGAMSTRAYACRSVELYRRLLDRTLNEAYAHPARIVGPRSFVRIVRASLFPEKDGFTYNDPPHSIERVVVRAIKRMGLRVRFVSPLGVTGILAGSGQTVSE